MKLSVLPRRSRTTLPGLAGIARVDRRTDGLLRRLKAGEIAVLDQIDLDRATADALVAAGVAAVVNASPSISGRFPNLGPEILLDNGVTLLDGVGTEALSVIKDGAKIRLHEGVVYAGELRLVEGVHQDAESVAGALIEARTGLTHQLEAFAANTIEFMQHERDLLLDGLGVPPVDVELANRQVVVVAAGYDHVGQLRRLRDYLKEYRPVLIGVGAGADALLKAGRRPDLVLGDPSEISDEALTCGAEIVVPAFADGHAPGLHRVQDLGVQAVTFPSTANPEDLALLLAEHEGAAMVVTVGLSATMAEFLDRGRSGSNASTFLTRLQLGGRLVDAGVISTLYRSRVSRGAILLLVGAVVAAAAAALLVSAAGDAVLDVVLQLWERLVAVVGGWLR